MSGEAGTALVDFGKKLLSRGVYIKWKKEWCDERGVPEKSAWGGDPEHECENEGGFGKKSGVAEKLFKGGKMSHALHEGGLANFRGTRKSLPKTIQPLRVFFQKAPSEPKREKNS